MALSYDFDMFSVMPLELQAKFGEDFAALGLADAMKQQTALFRDQAVVDGLQGASQDVKQCLWDSGFGINRYDSGVGPGVYPPSDEAARTQVLGRLRQNVRRLPPDADWNGFDIHAFFEAAAAARPLGTQARSFGEMRRAERAPERTATSTPAQPGRPNLDDFFSMPARNSAAAATAPAPGPDMDAFFSGKGGLSTAGAAFPALASDEIGVSRTSTPIKKIGFGPVKMGLMALGLYAVISVLGSGSAGKMIGLDASGTRMVTMDR